MANKVYSYYKDLPSWAKGVVVVGGIAIAYFTAKQLIARLRNQAEKKDLQKEVDDQKSELNKLVNRGVMPSFSGSQYKSWANDIVNAFKGCDASIRVPILAPTSLWNKNWSTSGAKFINIIYKFKNDADFLALSTAFGVKTYPQCLSWFNKDFTGTLSQAITDELDEQEITSINEALAKQGITYKF